MSIFEYIQSNGNNDKLVKELNEKIFGGDESTEAVFMENIDQNIK
jgi:hypothetical protein